MLKRKLIRFGILLRRKLIIKLPGKSILKLGLSLLLALFFLLFAVKKTVEMTRQELNEYAEAESDQKLAYINTISNTLFISNEWILSSFLAGVTDIFCSQDSITNEIHFKFVITDDMKRSLTVDEVSEKLHSFLNYHYDYYSAIMIFEPNVLNEAPNGIAIRVTPKGSSYEDLCKNFNILNGEFYKYVKEKGEFVLKDLEIRSQTKFVSTSAVPFCDERGNVIGEFWIDNDADYYSKILQFFVIDKDVNDVAIINDNCKVISSLKSDCNGKYLGELKNQGGQSHSMDEWVQDVKKHVKQEENTQFKNVIDGDIYTTYIFSIKCSEYKLLIVREEKAVYGEVKNFMFKIIVILVISILIIVLSLVYNVYVFKKKNDENKKMEGELNVAAEIQRGILPKNLPADDSLSFDILGFQRSAKTVGGDLYDFEQKGDFLHFCIGDVSGKGMPAALVMTELISLYRYIVSYHSDPQEIVTLINKSLMEHSDESMFCTLFVGVLNLKTGLLEFCNAGHNPPILILNGKSEAQYLKIKPNMPVYAFENYEYQTERLQLNASDKLFLYTDGVTEAKNENNCFYGNNAVLASVSKHRSKNFDKLVQGVLDDVKSFVKKADQNDDITILCVEYKGMQDCTSLHYDNMKHIVTQIVDDVLTTCGLTENMKFRLAIEEPVQNIADYAYKSDGPLNIEIFENVWANQFEITLIDNGKPFNPLENRLPDLSVPVQNRQIGGLGIYLTRNIMHEVSYKYVNQQNRLTLIYKLK